MNISAHLNFLIKYTSNMLRIIWKSDVMCHLESIALLQGSREQLAIAEFARSLLVIPKQLGINAAQDSTDLVAKLRAYHNMSQTKQEHRDLRW